MAAYTLGTISKLLAQSSSGEKPQKVDSKLAALFGGASNGSTSTVFKTVKVSETQLGLKNKSKPISFSFENGKATKKKDDVKLKHKDAAAIRVDAKQKIKAQVQESAKNNQSRVNAAPASTPKVKLTVKKNRVKTDKPPPGHYKKTRLQDETISSTSQPATPSEVKKRKPKARSKELKEIRKQKRAQARLEQERKEALLKNEEEEETVEDDKPKEDGDSSSDDEESTPVEKPTGKESAKTLAERNAPKAKDPELEKRTLFVGNLPAETERKAVLKMFKKFGEVECVRLRCGAPNRPTLLKKVAINRKELHPDHNTIAAYVRFSTREEAEKAAEESVGLVLNDNHLVVDLADGSKKKDNKMAVFVGNLSLKLSDDELWHFFEDCGKVVSVRVVRDRATGMGKGFGYVNFNDKGAVELALKKNQEVLKNRTVRISRCVKKVKVKKEKKFGGGKKPNSRDGMRNDYAGNPKSESWKPKGKFGGDKQHSFQKKKSFGEVQEYGGDRLAEIGKLKRKSKKPNRGELRKTNIAKILTKPSANNAGGNKKKYFT